jgi:hypothetical protein
LEEWWASKFGGTNEADFLIHCDEALDDTVLEFVALFHEGKHGGNSDTIVSTNGGNTRDELAVFKLDGNASFIEFANSNHIKVALDANGFGSLFAFGGWDGEENVAAFVFFVWNAKSIAPLHDGLASFSKVE